MARATWAAQSGAPADETRDPTVPASVTWADGESLNKCFESEELMLMLEIPAADW